ncbi:HNH endonuclease family protein [Streptomyces sp. NPDC089919]|uniref:HNH endonuclease family protein n=1 Tax=Streptomyces sp. NPDC089919 TaxID=3155188 RepID=UPI00341BDF8C
MIKNLLVRALPAFALAVLPAVVAPAAYAVPSGQRAAAPVAGGPAGVRAPLPLVEAIDRLPVAREHREGYQRTLYKHWNRGLNPSDGCDTRKEVILAEAVEAPQVAAGCKLTGGTWRSAYDDTVVTDAARLDVDHFVPLAEVYDSEPAPWTAARREAYANDQDSPDTLIAVSAASNRSKADKDPAEWMPPNAAYRCTYAATWVGTKLRWDLAVDTAEHQALMELAAQCPVTTVVYEPAPAV